MISKGFTSDRECDWEAPVRSNLSVPSSSLSHEEAEVTLQASDPLIDFSQRLVLTTEPDEFNKDFVRYPNRRAGHYSPTSHCKRDPESTSKTQA